MKFLKFLFSLFNPVRIYRAFRYSRNRPDVSKEELDTELQFYRNLLDSDFIHLGYFEDPDVSGSEISFADVKRAQERYADLVMEHVEEGPVLDSGCGAGGLLRKLSQENYSAVGLTPDEAQIGFIREQQPGQDLIHAKMEDIDTDEYKNHFATVVNMESFQYIDMDEGFEVTETVLAEDGRWVLTECFRRRSGTDDDSRHHLDRFREKLRERNWSIEVEEDITDNILVSIKFARLLADRILVSAVDYGTQKLKTLYPFFYGMLKDLIGQGEETLEEKLKMIDPERFRENKTYRLFVLERDGTTA